MGLMYKIPRILSIIPKLPEENSGSLGMHAFIVEYDSGDIMCSALKYQDI